MLFSISSSETKIQHTDCARSQPPILFGVVLFVALTFLLGRGFLPSQAPPALSSGMPEGVRVLLGEGFANPGVHQFSDGLTIADVMKLTAMDESMPVGRAVAGGDDVLIDGMTLSLGNPSEVANEIEQGWMPARQRLALGIPLHPDRMSREDWVTLPGIGEKLALQIEQDRQIYGDFGRFEALERVKGIGPAKLEQLRQFFVQNYK